MEHLQVFEHETRQLHHRRVCSFLLAAIGVMGLFTLLDYLLIPDFFKVFFTFRLLAMGSSALLLLINLFDRKQRLTWLLGSTGYLLCGFIILLSLYYLGDVTSPYYVGLIVFITAYTAITPLTIGQTLISGFSLICIYLLSVFLIDTFSDYQLLSLFSNLFFMICFVFIAATHNWVKTTAREQEWELRLREKKIADRLQNEAEQLEQEVQKRVAEQELSEKRYQLLYESVVDAVVLLNHDGRLLQANQSYNRQFLNGHALSQTSFFDVIHTEDKEHIHRILHNVMSCGDQITGHRLALIPPKGAPVETEISGALLCRGDKKLGLQLVIRDISIRLQLEQSLRKSLKAIRHAENATILALAKLSEYRDLTPDQHLERLRDYCSFLAIELSQTPQYKEIVTQTFRQDLYQGAILHDIGKVALSDTILGQEASLTTAEEQLLRDHTRIGGQVIESMEQETQGRNFLTLAKNIAYFHHEHWDGSGYPEGRHGKHIPLEARIFAVADRYEELTISITGTTSSHQEAMQRISLEAEKRFDPDVVHALLRCQQKFQTISMCIRTVQNEKSLPHRIID